MAGELETIAEIIANIEFSEGGYIVKCGAEMHEDIRFTIAAHDLKSVRYAAALIATGSVQLAELLLREH